VWCPADRGTPGVRFIIRNSHFDRVAPVRVPVGFFGSPCFQCIPALAWPGDQRSRACDASDDVIALVTTMGSLAAAGAGFLRYDALDTIER
jgi:hypothetical protein